MKLDCELTIKILKIASVFLFAAVVTYIVYIKTEECHDKGGVVVVGQCVSRR